jgi:acyl carrier protein
MATIYERVRKVTIAQLEIKESQVSAVSSFAGDLGADSLDLVELIMALEEEFTTPERRISIPDEDAEKIATVHDAVEYLRKLGVTDFQPLPKPVEKPGFKPVPPRPFQGKPIPPRPADGKPVAQPPGASTGTPPARKGRRRDRRGGYDRQSPNPPAQGQMRTPPSNPGGQPPPRPETKGPAC